MMVQASEEVGEDSDHPTDSNQIPIVDQPSTSSQPKQKQKSKRKHRTEAEVAHDETEHEESVPTPSNDPLPSILDDDEVFVDVTTVEKEKQSTKTGEAVTTGGVEDSAAPTIPTTVEETLAQTLMEIKAAKRKAKGIVFHNQEEQVSVSKLTVSVKQPSVKDKGKGIIQEPEKPLKTKEQVALDE
ncbi:hypothetical protein Tco_0185606 [Tanacetum coccineum]